MPNQPYFPPTEGRQIMWFTNLQVKIANYYTELDISTDRQAKITLTLAWLIWTWGTFMMVRRQENRAGTQWRNRLAHGPSDSMADPMPPVPATLTPPTGTPYFGMLTWLFEEIGRWKKAEGYTDMIGQDLAIVGAAAPPPDPGDVPEVKGEISGQEVILHFLKHGHDGVWIEGQVGDETVWSFLAIDTSDPYNDTRPLKVAGQPEMRRYRICYWDNDTPSNIWSNIVEVAFGA